jgi:FKBP-type peptidyl-prolyl cis-trans isomerase FkpA
MAPFMKKFFLFSLAIAAVFGYFACTKDLPDNPACTNALPYSDSSQLINFAGDSIPLTIDSTGLIYHIIDSGSAVRPGPSAYIRVNYIGKSMTNHIFDSASNSNLNGSALDQLILGWRIGLPKIGEGGHILLFIPSAYAWGCTGYGPVGPNQPVFFDVTLLKVY